MRMPVEFALFRVDSMPPGGASVLKALSTGSALIAGPVIPKPVLLFIDVVIGETKVVWGLGVDSRSLT